MEHSNSANDQLMAAKRADKQHDLDKVMASFHQLVPLVAAVACLSIAEKLTLAFMEQDVEKALGRPLTSYDRVLLRKEYERRQACIRLMALFEVCNQRCRDNETIRQVVWRRG